VHRDTFIPAPKSFFQFYCFCFVSSFLSMFVYYLVNARLTSFSSAFFFKLRKKVQFVQSIRHMNQIAPAALRGFQSDSWKMQLLQPFIVCRRYAVSSKYVVQFVFSYSTLHNLHVVITVSKKKQPFYHFPCRNERGISVTFINIKYRLNIRRYSPFKSST